MLKIGTKVIWLVGRDTEIRSGVVAKTGKSYGERSVWLEGATKPEDALLEAFLFVDTEASRQVLTDRMAQTKRHREEDDAMMKRVYETLNQQVRDGLR